MFITQLTSVFLWPLEISMVHMKNINENVINLKLNFFVYMFFFHFLFITKMTFFICFRESRKVVEWPRFAPFHCQIKKSSRRASPPEPPPPSVGTPRCARLFDSLRSSTFITNGQNLQILYPNLQVFRVRSTGCQFQGWQVWISNIFFLILWDCSNTV